MSDPTGPTFEQPGATPPPPPPPPPPEPWSAPPVAPAEEPKRRRGMVLGAVVVVVALVAGFLGWQFTRGSGDIALALGFTKGQSQNWRMQMTFTGTIDAPDGQGGTTSQPMDMDMTMDMGWKVTDVAADGTATIEISASAMSGSVNGSDLGDLGAPTTMTMKIAKDGTIVEDSGLGLSSLSGTGGAGLPGMGSQLTPILPDHPVSPGDTWNKDYSQELPYGMGTMSIQTRNRFARYEDVDGVEAAVIQSDITLPLDMTIDLGEMLAAMAENNPDLAAGAGEVQGVTIDYGGSMTMHMTSWIASDEQRLLKSDSTGTFDISMAFSGMEGLSSGMGGEFEASFRGDFTQKFERI